MPNAYVLNQRPTSYSAAHWLLIQMLVGAGWTFKSSGDGLAAFSSTGSVFTNGSNAGAGGFGQAKAWARLQDPVGVREIVYQHDNAGALRLKYSPSATFIGGAPAATVTPSATDEQYLRGGTTDAVPTYGGQWLDAGVVTGLTKFQGAAQAAAPYSFWFAGAATPAGAVKTGVCMDGVTSVPEDPDPVVWHIGAAGAFDPAILGQNSGSNPQYPTPGGTAQGNFGFADAPKTSFRHWQACSYVAANPRNSTNGTALWVADQGLVVNPFNAKTEGLPIPYIRTSSQANAGLKGWSTQMRWTGVPRTTFIDTADNKNWICVFGVWLPWDGVTVPTN